MFAVSAAPEAPVVPTLNWAKLRNRFPAVVPAAYVADPVGMVDFEIVYVVLPLALVAVAPGSKAPCAKPEGAPADGISGMMDVGGPAAQTGMRTICSAMPSASARANGLCFRRPVRD